MTSISEIDLASKVESRVSDLEVFWAQRNLQWAMDRALLHLQYRQRLRPYELIISNEPAVHHSGAIAILAGKEPLYRLPISIQELEQRDKMDKGERFVYGIMREVDKRWRLKGHGPWLHEFMHYACLGAIAGQPRIVKRPRRAPEFHCDLFDPMTVYPSFGEDGLVEVARVYETTYDHAVSICRANGWNGEYVRKEEEVKITNYWRMGRDTDDEDPTMPYNAVLMGGRLVKPPTAHDEFSRVPIFISPMNGVPWRGLAHPSVDLAAEQEGALSIVDWTASWGRPIFWQNRTLYRALDRVLSYEAERSRRAAWGKYVALTEDGQLAFSEQDFKTAEIITMNATTGESLTPLATPPMPAEARSLVDQVFSMVQRGGLNRLALGDLNLEISGVTLERAIAAARYILGPYQDGGQRVLSDIAMSFFDQAKRLRLSKVNLEVRQADVGAEIAYVMEEFGRGDIPDTTYVEVSLPMLLPDDRMRKATIARQLIPGNKPLVDERTVAEEILDVQDWNAVKQRRDEDLAESSPAVAAIRQMGAIGRLIGEWRQDPKMVEWVPLAQEALGVMRTQFRELSAPREQPAGSLTPRSREPAPSVASSEESGVSPTEAEVAAQQSSRLPTNPKLRAMIQDMTEGIPNG